MRKLSILGTIAVLTLGAGMTLAASPAPATPSPSTSTGTGSSTTTPAPPSQASTQSAPQTSWSATVRPLHAVTGSVGFRQEANGTGVVTLKLAGMSQEAAWFVDIDGGTAARPNESDEIAERSGADVIRTGRDTLSIRLTKAEMDAFLKDRSRVGIVVSISDGSRQSVATLPAG